MKRVFAFLLVAVMLFAVCAVGASAEQYNESYGDVPKVPFPLSIDGEMEGAYEKGVFIPCTRVGGGSGAAIDGYAYVLYDDNYLYLYVVVADGDYGINFEDSFHFCYEHGCQLTYQDKTNSAKPTCEHVTAENADKRNMWDDDCVEVFIDWENDGEGSPSQYRISRHGEMSHDWWIKDTGFQGKGKDYGSFWCAEYAIGLDSSAKGTGLGIDIMLHSEEADFAGEYWCFAQNSYDMGASWQSQYYDYIVLGEELNIDDDPIFTGTVPPPSPSIPTGPRPTGSGPIDDPSNPNPSNTNPTGGPANDKKPPKTADPIVMIVFAATLSLGAAVVVKKTCFSK